MNTNSLKFQVLEWLFEAYMEHPDTYVNINEFLQEKGISSEASMINFGYALKAAGFLKNASSCNAKGEFMACISVSGIDFVSTAIKDETRKLIRYAIEENEEDYLVLNDRLKLIPNNTEYAHDIARYLKENNLAEIREENGQLLYKLTDLALIIFNNRPGRWESGEDESGLNQKLG